MPAKNAESVSDMKIRIEKFINNHLLKECQDQDRILLVSHAIFLKEMVHVLDEDFVTIEGLTKEQREGILSNTSKSIFDVKVEGDKICSIVSKLGELFLLGLER